MSKMGCYWDVTEQTWNCAQGDEIPRFVKMACKVLTLTSLLLWERLAHCKNKTQSKNIFFFKKNPILSGYSDPVFHSASLSCLFYFLCLINVSTVLLIAFYHSCFIVLKLECLLNQFDIATVIKRVMIFPALLSWRNIKGRFIHPEVQYHLPSGKGKFYITERAAQFKNLDALYTELQRPFNFYYVLFIITLPFLTGYRPSFLLHFWSTSQRKEKFLSCCILQPCKRIRFSLYILKSGRVLFYFPNTCWYFFPTLITIIENYFRVVHHWYTARIPSTG